MADPLALERASTSDPMVIEQLTKLDEFAKERLEVLAGLRADIEGTTINVEALKRKCPLDQTSPSSTTLTPHWKDTVSTRPLGHFGQLDELPLETTQAIFALLDLQTLTDLRAVNRSAMVVVDSLPLYREIYTHVPEVLRAMLSTKLARHFELWQIVRELRSPDCCRCGDFGAFLFLPGCARCCWYCLTEAEDILPISKNQAMESFELSNNILPEMPAMLSLPGSYGVGTWIGNRIRDGKIIYKRRTWLVSLGVGRWAARKLHGGHRFRQAYMDSPRNWWKEAYAQQLANRSSIDSSPLRVAKPPFHPFAKGSPNEGYEPRRFTSAIRMPLLDPATGKTQWGVSCIGCGEGYAKRLDYCDIHKVSHSQCLRMYSRKAFLLHAKHCRWARKRWRKHRPTFARVHTKYLDPEILDERKIPWAWDDVSTFKTLAQMVAYSRRQKLDSNFILIRRDISEIDIDDLAQHTRVLRRCRLPTRWRKELEGLDIYRPTDKDSNT